MKLNKKIWMNMAVIGLMMATAASAQTPSKIVEPGEELFGLSYNELVSHWTNWLVAEPIATNPAFDPDGRFCGQNQSGRVWFLASAFEGVANRTCVIPSDKGIFVSLGGAFVSFAPDFPSEGDLCLQAGGDLEQVRCDVNNDVPVAPSIALRASLDGIPVRDLFAYRAQSQPGGFTLRVPNPSFLTDLGITPGDRTPAVGDGYFLFLKPLRPGRHTLNIRMVNPDQTETGVNYTLIVL